MNHMRQLLNHANVSAFQEVGSEGSKHGHSSLAFPCWLCTTNATAMLITKAKEHYWVLIQLPYLPSSVARYLQSSVLTFGAYRKRFNICTLYVPDNLIQAK
eukprot:856004-Pelagomonas_calceolata.AAC.1